MNREERIRAVISGQEPDRIPVSVWMHLSKYDQDPRSLAEAMVEFNETYDFDFIKMMPFGAYTIPDWGAKLDIYCDKYKEVEIAAPGIVVPEDYKGLKVLEPTHGTWGKTLQLAQYMSKYVKPNTPYIQTIFSPATTLKKLAGARMIGDLVACPELVHEALEKAGRQDLIGFGPKCLIRPKKGEGVPAAKNSAQAAKKKVPAAKAGTQNSRSRRK